MVFLEKSSKLLLFLHLAGTFVLIGSMTHNLILVVGYWRGRFGKKNLEKLYAQIAFWAYTTVFVIGAVVYPTFRVRVRHEYFDKFFPWTTGLFEVKEHWAAIGLALFLAYYFLRTHVDPEAEREKLPMYTGLCCIIYAIVWYSIAVGYYLTTLKGV